MTHLAQIWDARSRLTRNIVDIGCGLGGGSLFWAQEYNARVTAVTCVPSHISWIAKFAEQAGVAEQVQPFLSDAVQVPGEECFDAAVAIESSCHMPRGPLLRRLASLLRHKGSVFIEDYFTERKDITDLFHRHWESPLGSLEEYRAAGEEAGLQLEAVDDLTDVLAPYWDLSAALMTIEVRNHTLTAIEKEKHARSLTVHTRVGQFLRSHHIEALALSFRKV
jgi:cyclopropane fatty-acyl-phospholipid synthase-like methyltransferase